MKKYLLRMLCAFVLFLPTVAHAAPLLFGSPEEAADVDPLYQQTYGARWSRVLEAEKQEPGFSARGERLISVDAQQWQNLIKKAATSQEVAVLRMINGYFNQWRPQDDAAAWETPEYWASPAEFIKIRGGDCEDYAIAKYFALRFLGFPAERLRVVVIRQVGGDGKPVKQLHAVLAAFTNGTWFILDNNARPRHSITPHTQYQGRFVPLYSMNENSAWKHRPDPLTDRQPVARAVR